VAKEYKLTTEIHREKTQSFRREIKKNLGALAPWWQNLLLSFFVLKPSGRKKKRLVWGDKALWE
jgi:hypothetical protein